MKQTLTNVTYFPGGPSKPVDIVIQDGIIESITPSNPRSPKRGFNAKAYWVLPGFVNGHTHVAMTFMKSLCPQVRNVIHRWMFPLESKLTEEDVYHFSRLGIAECLLGGSTSIFDHYYYPSAIAEAAKDLGIRAAIAPTVLTRGGPFPKKTLYDEMVRFFKRSAHALIHPVVGPHATNTVHPKDMGHLIEFAKDGNFPIHMHVSQTEYEFKHAKEKLGMTPIAFLEKLNCFDQPTLLAHAIYLEKDDFKRLDHPNIVLGICPSALVLFDKLCPKDLFHKKNISIGCDACSNNDTMDIGKEARNFVLFARALQDQAFPTQKPNPEKVLRSMQNGALQILRKKHLKGKIQVGAAADLVFIQKDALNLHPLFDPHWAFTMNLWPENITHVMVNGQFVVKHRQLTQVKAATVLKESTKYLKRLLKRTGLPKRLWAEPFSS